MKNQNRLKKSLLCSSVLLALGLHAELALAVNHVDYGPDNNFTMLDPGGGGVGGTNLVNITWDGTLNTDVATAVSNMTISSAAPFFGMQWFANNVQVFGPGTYTFEACPGPPDPVTFKSADGSTSCSIDNTPQTMVVGAGQVGVHMLFDWNSSVNIDVVNVWDINSIWQYGPNDGTGSSKLQPADSICVAPSKKSAGTPEECAKFYATQWLFAAIDPDGDGVPGSQMVDGPFKGFNANFNVQALGVFAPNNDSVFTVENDSIITVDVLANDSLPGAAGAFTVTAFDATSEKGGSVTSNGDGTFTYVPPVGFKGLDSFAYTVSDGISTSAARVDVVVLSEAAGAQFIEGSGKAATANTAAASSGGSSGGATGLLALSVMLLLLPLRLFNRKK